MTKNTYWSQKNRQLSYHSSYMTSLSQWMAHKNITPYSYMKRLTLEDFHLSQTVDKKMEIKENNFCYEKYCEITKN